MKVRFASQQEISNWDNLILANPDGGNVFSSLEFAMQKINGGYKPRFIIVNNIAVTVLEKNTLVLGKLWYIPKGPNITSTKELFTVLDNLKEFAIENNVFAIRIEPELERNQQPTLTRHGLVKSKPIIPNPSTIKFEISDSLDKIFANLPQKSRYAIKRAERDGVTVKLVESTNENCEIMYNLLSKTAEGQFGIRSYDYYKTFWQRFEASGYGQLLFAYFNEQVVAGAYALIYGTKSTYKDGASVRERTAYGASHLLQWKVIEWAKLHGSKIHDLCGSPPSEEISNSNHKHYGIGLFKTSFHKKVTDYIGCYDLVINEKKYKVWVRIGERIAHRLHYMKNHDSYY